LPTASDIANAVQAAGTWDARVALIRRVPEEFGTAQHASVYAAIAKQVYVPDLKADFAYVHWRDEYELAPLAEAYGLAHNLTDGFLNVAAGELGDVLLEEPQTLSVFRLLLGLTRQEFSEACSLVAAESSLPGVGKGRLDGMEGGRKPSRDTAIVCATVIDLMMTGQMFPEKPAGSTLRRKLDKPDTSAGWESVRHYAKHGIPLAMFLHQRSYGGAFRQLTDATSTQRGDILEDPVEELFVENGIPFIRTGSHNQAEIEARFGITVRPAPDFVVFDGHDALRALLECKGASDGGTARDKASRFQSLRAEAKRVGGVPVFAVLGGVGWRRTQDALGPVVRDTDGRTFTAATLSEMIETEPFPGLCGLSQVESTSRGAQRPGSTYTG
jgi:hypothetical protein